MMVLANTPTFRKPKIPSTVLATLFVVCSEVMLFAALVSAYLIIKAGSGVVFVPPTHITLPVLATAVNTGVLFLSGVFVHLATVKFRTDKSQARKFLLLGLVCGALFVTIQGYEWVKLISFGMTMTSGIFGACFFLLIGTHGVHAAAAVLIMLYLYLRKTELRLDNLQALRIFWFFVVGIWPGLYGLVYF